MRLIGLEPTRCETPDPKSGASTNFATGALFVVQRYKLTGNGQSICYRKVGKLDLDRELNRDLNRELNRDLDSELNRKLERDLERELERDLDRELDSVRRQV